VDGDFDRLNDRLTDRLNDLITDRLMDRFTAAHDGAINGSAAPSEEPAAAEAAVATASKVVESPSYFRTDGNARGGFGDERSVDEDIADRAGRAGWAVGEVVGIDGARRSGWDARGAGDRPRARLRGRKLGAGGGGVVPAANRSAFCTDQCSAEGPNR
jgi:hypothetical protein